METTPPEPPGPHGAQAKDPPRGEEAAVRQVFVDPGRRRRAAVRWTGRGVALAVLAYLVILGASLARAPWAPRLSLPGIGAITPPDPVAAPPKLGSNAVSTPVPAAVLRATAPKGGSSPGSGGGGATTTTRRTSTSTSTSAPGTTTTTSRPGLGRGTTTTTGASTGSTGPTTSTTRSSPSATAPGRTTTTTVAGSTTSTTRPGRSKTR